MAEHLQVNRLNREDISVDHFDLAPLCSLCGGSFGEARVLGRPTTPSEKHWSQLACAIRGDKSSDDTSEEDSFVGRCIAYDRSLGSILDGNALTDPFRVVEDQFASYVRGHGPKNYRVHELCWLLLLRRIRILKGPESSPQWVAKWLFRLLAALPYSSKGGLLPQHGYFGAVNYRRHSGDRLDICLAYPRQSQPWKEFKRAKSMPLPDSSYIKRTSLRDPFDVLPPEILDAIFPLLSSKDLCNARLASRWLAIHGAPSALPVSFWRSRFFSDADLGFLDVRYLPKSSVDCFRLVWRYKQLLESVPEGEGLKNRRRIWSCLEPFAVTIASLWTAEKLESLSTLGHEEDLEVGQKMSCLLIPRIDTPPRYHAPAPTTDAPLLQFGAQVHYVRRLSFDSLKDGATLQVSTVSFQHKSYICGFKLYNLGSNNVDVQEHGLFIPSRTTSISLKPDFTIRKIKVYLSIDGVHGLVFVSKDSFGNTIEQAVGATASQGCYSAVATLEAKGPVSGLLFEFDTFKAVSVQMIDRSCPEPPLCQPMLWGTMHLPLGELPTSMGDLPAANGMSIHYFVPFGGEDGSRLSSLIRITVLHDGTAGFYGLAFDYLDSGEVLYGSNATLHDLGQSIPCTEQSFTIDGPGGERITNLAFSTAFSPHTGNKCVVSLEITTQFHRYHEFRAFDQEIYDKVERVVVNITEDHYPTGLVAPLWCLSAVCVSNSIPATGGSTVVKREAGEVAITQQVLNYAPWMTYKRGASFTSASLVGVRRIRISTGRLGRSCSTKHISGLWLHYRDNVSDAIVGQWLNETGSFSLEADESLVEIIVTITETIRPSRAWAWKATQIIGVAFKTTAGRLYHFDQSHGDEGGRKKVILAYRASSYEKLGTITWASRLNTDDIQVDLRPSTLLGSGHLLFCQAEHSFRPPWLCMNETRKFFDYSDPNLDFSLSNRVDVQQAIRRYSYCYEAFFWEERGHSLEEPGRLQKIEMVFYDKGVRGLRCTWGANKNDSTKPFSRSCGLDVDYHFGSKYTLNLNPNNDEQISLIMARRVASGGYGLELHTSEGQICRAMPEDEEDYEIDSYAMTRGARPPKATNQTVWRKTHWSFPDGNPTNQMVSNCVGIWVSGKKLKDHKDREDNIDAFGPIYVTDPSIKPGLMQGLRQKLHDATIGGGWSLGWNGVQT